MNWIFDKVGKIRSHGLQPANRAFHAIFVSGEHSMSMDLYRCPGGSCKTSVSEDMVDRN